MGVVEVLNINYSKKVGKSGGMWGIVCNFVAEFQILDVHMRFLGNYEARCDAKGRVFLPAVFRKVLQGSGEEKLVLRRDVFQSCLVLYPESVWNEQMDSLRARLNRWDNKQQQVYRQFVSEAELVQLDGNGRFLISRRCMKAVEMEADVRFVGMGDTIEIWSVKKADEALMDEKTFGEALQDLMKNEELGMRN